MFPCQSAAPRAPNPALSPMQSGAPMSMTTPAHSTSFASTQSSASLPEVSR